MIVQPLDSIILKQQSDEIIKSGTKDNYDNISFTFLVGNLRSLDIKRVNKETIT